MSASKFASYDRTALLDYISANDNNGYQTLDGSETDEQLREACAAIYVPPYQAEFSGITIDRAILDAVETGKLVDTSWHNDMRASFCLTCDKDKQSDEHATLWVDYDDVAEREGGVTSAKYLVVLSDSTTAYTGDDAEAALAALVAAGEKSDRFVWCIGAIQELYTDIPDSALPNDGSAVLWDRQEKKAVMTLHAPYGQLFCLETLGEGAASAPLSAVEEWVNNTSNEALESEGIPPTEGAKK